MGAARSDHERREHPELDFDPLDDTKLWPNDRFPLAAGRQNDARTGIRTIFRGGRATAFGVGVLVDGLDFSDDKMLQGRTFSYSDTQRHRAGANYLQLPINAPKKQVATNQSGGLMQIKVDRAPGQNPHINYEPSMLGGLVEAMQPGKEHEPFVQGNLVRRSIDRQDNTKQAGETFRNFEEWEKAELIANLVGDLSRCDPRIQARMMQLAVEADGEYGRRLTEGLERAMQDGSSRKPLGNRNGDQAPGDAVRKGHDAEPY